MIYKFSTVLFFLIFSMTLATFSFGQSISQVQEKSLIRNQIILKIKSAYQFKISTDKHSLGIHKLDNIARKYGNYSIKKIGQSIPKTPKLGRPNFNLIAILEYDEEIDIASAIQDFESSGIIEYAESNGTASGSGKVIEEKMKAMNQEILLTPNEEFYTAQWWANNNGTYHDNFTVPNYFPDCISGADINLEPAWDITTGCSSVVIALLDTGMKLDHPEMAGRIIGGYDFANDDADPTDDQGHGSNVGGIAFANGNEGGIHAGVNWNADVLIIKVLDQNNQGQWTWIADGIIWAVDNGATIMNASLGGTDAPQIVKDAVMYAYNNNVALIVAAGNDNIDNSNYQPASYPETITVGATTCNDVRVSNNVWGSSFGTAVDLVAPGSSIYGLQFDSNDFGFWWGGTSQATPMVTGVASLMLCIDPALTVEDIRTILRSTADDQVGDPSEDTFGYDVYYGAGRLNAEAALLAIIDCDSTQVGIPCDDNDLCTIDDVLNEFCICRGTFQDTDNDNICDGEDECPGFDDDIDVDLDGIPDGCDPSVDCLGIVCEDNDPCTINDQYDMDCNCIGTFFDSDNDGLCNLNDPCPGDSNNNCPTDYCIPTSGVPDIHISNVKMGMIDNTTTFDTGYGDFSYLTNEVFKEAITTIQLTVPFASEIPATMPISWMIWVDLNQDGVFDNITEKVLEQNIQADTSIAEIIIPNAALNGGARMRITAGIAIAEITPCGNILVGESEDYTLIIKEEQTTGIRTIISKNDLIIYPNPSNGRFTIDSKELELLRYSVYDSKGIKVFSEESNKDDLALDFLTSGLYFLILETENEVLSKKILIQH